MALLNSTARRRRCAWLRRAWNVCCHMCVCMASCCRRAVCDRRCSCGAILFTARRALALFVATNFLIYLDRGIIPGAAVDFQAFIGATAPWSADKEAMWLGALQSVFIGGYAVAALVFGRLAHFYPPFRLVGAGLLVWCGAVVMCGLARRWESLSILLLARLLTGVGEASFQCIAPPFIDDFAPKGRKSIWLAIFYTVIPVGTALGFGFGAAFASIFGWQWAFFVEAALMLPCIVACFLLGGTKLVARARSNRISTASTSRSGRILPATLTSPRASPLGSSSPSASASSPPPSPSRLTLPVRSASRAPSPVPIEVPGPRRPTLTRSVSEGDLTAAELASATTTATATAIATSELEPVMRGPDCDLAPGVEHDSQEDGNGNDEMNPDADSVAFSADAHARDEAAGASTLDGRLCNGHGSGGTICIGVGVDDVDIGAHDDDDDEEEEQVVDDDEASSSMLLPRAAMRKSKAKAAGGAAATAAATALSREASASCTSGQSSAAASVSTSLPGAVGASTGPGTLRDELRIVLRSSLFVLVVLGASTYTAAIAGFGAFGPQILLQRVDSVTGERFFTSQTSASMTFGAVIALAGTIGTPLGGLLVDRAAMRAAAAEAGTDIASAAAAAGASGGSLHARVAGDDRWRLLAALRHQFVAAVLGCVCIGFAIVSQTRATFLQLLGIGCTALFSTTSTVTLCVLEAVPAPSRAFAIALNTLLIHALGDVPSPVVIGTLKDWLAPGCKSSSGGSAAGAEAAAGGVSARCSTPSNQHGLRLTMGAVLCWLSVTLIFWGLAWAWVGARGHGWIAQRGGRCTRCGKARCCAGWLGRVCFCAGEARVKDKEEDSYELKLPTQECA